MSNAGTRLLNLTAFGLLGLLALDATEWGHVLNLSVQGIGSAAASDELANGIARSISSYRSKPAASLDIVTGAADAPAPAEAPANKKSDDKAGGEAKPSTTAKADGEAQPKLPEIDSADKLLLERLVARRLELDKRDKDLVEREALLAAAEKQIEGRMAELKALDETIKTDMARKDADVATLKPIIIMYEAMKPKDAARIFEKLDLKSVLPIAGGMNPKKFSEILAQLDPVIAGKLTVGLSALTNAQSLVQNDKMELPELADAPLPKTR